MASGALQRTPAERVSPGLVAPVLLAWLAAIGLDFFLHAGLLAPLYDWDSPFLLSPEEAFVRIPFGYLGLLILVIGLAWLLLRLGVDSGRGGALVGGTIGAVVWGANLVGLWSISTAEPGLLLGWWVGQTVELGLAGFVIGALLGGSAVRRLAWRIAAIFVVAAVSAVVLQVLGYATAPIVRH